MCEVYASAGETKRLFCVTASSLLAVDFPVSILLTKANRQWLSSSRRPFVPFLQVLQLGFWNRKSRKATIQANGNPREQ